MPSCTRKINRSLTCIRKGMIYSTVPPRVRIQKQLGVLVTPIPRYDNSTRDTKSNTCAVLCRNHVDCSMQHRTEGFHMCYYVGHYGTFIHLENDVYQYLTMCPIWNFDMSRTVNDSEHGSKQERTDRSRYPSPDWHIFDFNLVPRFNSPST